MLFGKTKKVLEDKEAEIKLNLSNNYKDSAYNGYLEYTQLVNDFKDKGKIGDKDFEKLKYDDKPLISIGVISKKFNGWANVKKILEEND